MTVELVTPPGEPIAPEELSHPWAAAFARYVAADDSGALRLRECRRARGVEIVAVDVRADVPQRPKYGVRYDEPLAVLFDSEGACLPEVLALRTDFPSVPHLNLRREPVPKSLCLFAEPPEDLKLRWTPALLGQRLLWWLAETARGTLHAADQALEPFIGGVPRPLILPPLFAAEQKAVLNVIRAPLGDGREVLIADRPDAFPAGSPAAAFTLLAFRLPTQQHGVIHVEPETLRGLQDLCKAAGFDLLAELRSRLREQVALVADDTAGTILVLIIPKQRDTGGEVEATDVFGFRCRISTPQGIADLGPGKVGELLGLQSQAPVTGTGASYVPLFGPIENVEGAAGNVIVELLLPRCILTADMAAALSGHEHRETKRVLAVGQGALGSQLFENLVRQGYGRWVLVDEDYYAPHNATHHALLGRCFGVAKATQMAALANQMFVGPPMAEAIVANVLSPGSNTEALANALSDVDVILDLSGSVPVARHLALNVESTARRVAVFLNPAGSDLVMMAEDAGRAVPMDVLELTYFRAVIQQPELDGHLGGSGEPVRYGGSCRDLSSRISQEMVALHAAVGATAVRQVVRTDEPAIAVWRCERERMTVGRHDITVHRPLISAASNWTIVTDAAVCERLLAYRREKLPNETCGVLVGYLDMQRQRIYVVDALPAPRDTLEEPEGCERGTSGLIQAIEQIGLRTMGHIDYVGEWHSHPDGVPCHPSRSDMKQLEWAKSKMHREGKPALIVLVCRAGELTFIISEP